MHRLRIDAQSYGRFSEVFPDEPENVELMIEDAISRVLDDLFDEEAILDNISVSFTSPSPGGHREGTIHIEARCAPESFTMIPHTDKYILLALREGVSALLKELLGPVTIQQLEIVPFLAFKLS